MSTLRTTPGAGLTVCVIGGLTVCRHGRTLPPGEVGTRKARTLLAMLAVHRTLLPVDLISHALWGDTPPRDPAANVATLVSRLRSPLGPTAVVGASISAGYRLGDQVGIDLVDAANVVNEAELRIARRQPAQALRAAQRAAQLLDRGGVLPDHPQARWADPARDRHVNLLRRARHAIAEMALRLGDVRTAQPAAEAAVAADPFDEVGCRLLMRAHHAAGQPAWALATYHRLRATLSTELGVDPAPATRDLCGSILHDNSADTSRTAS